MAVNLETLSERDDVVFVPLTKALADSMRHRWTEPMQLRIERSSDTDDRRIVKLRMRPSGPLIDELDRLQTECSRLQARLRQLESGERNEKKRRRAA